jgi:hypothetical protein
MSSTIGLGGLPITYGSGISSSAASVIANMTGAPVAVTASRSLAASENGLTFTNDGATATVQLTIPLGLPVGTSYTLFETVAQNFGVTTTTGELILVNSGTGKLTCGAIAAGSTFTVKKLNSTTWGLMDFVGSVG